MAARKYEKYIITQVKPNLGTTAWHGSVPEAARGSGGRIVYLDGEVLPGAFWAEGTWILPDNTRKKDRMIAAHTHDYDEILSYFGTNMDDPHDLGAEIEFWLGDEQYKLTNSCIIYIPAHLQHCPLRVRSISRPVFHFATSPGIKKYF